jgi:hypothetical protein
MLLSYSTYGCSSTSLPTGTVTANEYVSLSPDWILVAVQYFASNVGRESQRLDLATFGVANHGPARLNTVPRCIP